MIAQSQNLSRNVQGGSPWICLFSLVLFPLSANAQDPEKSNPGKINAQVESRQVQTVPSIPMGKSFVVGSVVDGETRRPIAHAPLKFIFGTKVEGEKGPRIVKTDEKGQFKVEVPLGTPILCAPEPMSGYWLSPGKTSFLVGTSLEKPVVTLQIELNRGPIWNIQVFSDKGISEISNLDVCIGEETNDFLRTKLINGGNLEFENLWNMFTKPTPSTRVFLDQNGKGQFTQCGKSGKLLILMGAKCTNDTPTNEDIGLLITELIVGPKFDVTRVKLVNPIDGSDQTHLVDENGAKAMVRKARVTLQNGQPLLTFHLTRSPKQELIGTVVDSLGNPIPAVEIRKVFGSPTGSGEQPGVTKTDSNGRFQMAVPLYSHKQGTYLQLSFTKDGFAGIDSREIPLSKEPGKPIDVGMVSLVPGKTIPLQVVDQKDQPIAGARVSIQGDRGNFYAHSRLTLSTDEQGRGVLRNLPVGLMQVHLSHAGQRENQSIVVSPLDSENTELKFQIKPSRPNPTFKPGEPPVIGQLAPELVIDRWTDGKQHSLADFRGQVVVVNFWSMGWNPSVRGIPALRVVADKYEPKGVAFLSIHSPEGDLDQIKRWQKMLSWKILTGVDQGTTLFDGETLKRFGGRNPSIIMIDAEGKLAYTTRISPQEASSMDWGKKEKENKELAASLNIPWPLPAQDDAQSKSQQDRFFAAVLGKEIEKVMASKKR